MKKTLNMMLAMMAGAMAFTACSSDDILDNIENNEVAEAPSQLKPMTFTAVQEGQDGTRAAIDGLSIKWTAGDKISIFDGASENAGVQMFTLATGEGTTSATFTGSAADAGTYYALYPYAVASTSHPATIEDAQAAAQGNSYISHEIEYWKERYEDCDEYEKNEFFYMYHVTDELDDEGISEANKAIIYAYIKGENVTVPGVALDGSSIKNVVIPAEQTVATGQTVDPQAVVMVAKGDDKDALEFKNVCAYVKVTPKFDCYAIGITSNGNEQLAGKVTVNYNDGEPTTTVTANGTNTVYLVGDITADNAYYIAVRPEALASGFTIEFLTADGQNYYARSTSKTLALARSNVKNLGEFTTSGTWTTTSPTSGDDGNGHSWKLLTPTFKISAAMNIDEIGERAMYNDIPSWGADWVLPTAAEYAELYTKEAIKPANNNCLSIKGLGILKYCNNWLMDCTSVWGTPILWTSTPEPDKSNRQMALWTYNGTIQGVDITNTWNKESYLFKYNH